MKKIIKRTLKYISIYSVMIIFFIFILYAVSTIPNKKLEKNVIKSAEELRKEGTALIIQNFENEAYQDNYTDALMINTVYSIDEKEPIESIILARRSYNKNKTFSQWTRQNLKENEDPTEDLELTVENKNEKYYTYGRYWHGYIAYLRPLLLIFDYTTIRIIFSIILNILGITLVYIIYRKYDKVISIIIAVSLLIIGYQSSGLSLTYFSVLAISMITSIYIALKKDIKIEYFFIIGGLTSFFDLLTFPVLTLGMPLITYLIVNKEKLTYKKMLLMSLNWLFGYAIIWISKWIISDILFDQNIIKEAIDTVLERTSNVAYDKKINIARTIFFNISWIPFESLMTVLITIGIIIIAKKCKVRIINKEISKYLLISVLPIMWYCLTQNHSYMHCKYAYKNLILTLISLGIIDYKIIKQILTSQLKESKKKDERRN